VSPFAGVADLAPWQFDAYVDAEADGYATPEQLAVLEANPLPWLMALRVKVREAEEHLARARTITGPERAQVVRDLEDEVRRLATALARRDPTRPLPGALPGEGGADADDTNEAEPVVLQVSWEPGRVVAWAGGRGAQPATRDEVLARLVATRAREDGWSDHAAVPLPNGDKAEALEIPVGDVLGWLVGAGAGDIDEGIGPSVRWLGKVALWAVELTAHGKMVPILRRRTRRGANAQGTTGSYAVRWTPAMITPQRLTHLAEEMPGAVHATDRSVDARAVTRSALTGMVDAICRESARRIEVPAPPPRVRTGNDVAEAVLARLHGAAFDAPRNVADDVVARVEKWARVVTGEHAPLIVQLAAPDSGNAWHLSVYAPDSRNRPQPVEQAIVMAGSNRAHLEADLARLERMVPALLRPGGTRRGEVVLSGDEAWELMAELGPRLQDAGYDVRVPQLQRRKSAPSLRMFVDASADSQVGANQLANVRWSAVFDGVTLSAEEIRELAKEARPLIRAGGRWVAIEQADLKAAAEALAERASTTQLTGAEILRVALGLEESPLGGKTLVEGGGWAAELLAAAARVKQEPATPPDGFRGTLRSYQADALAWLAFLADAGLGGCLALDMGLGKTPTMLAHLLATHGDAPALVIAPPAVVGNWTAEAARFTPGLRVLVHHGASRASANEMKKEVAHADVVVTTYGTAVRDVEAIAKINWSTVVLDEAQAIKNPASDTAQQLRKVPARSRVALTGTPIENGLGDLWAILDFANPGLVGSRPQFIARLSASEGTGTRVEAEDAMRALNGILVFRRTKSEPEIAAELPDRIDELDHCAMTPEQIGLYQALLDTLLASTNEAQEEEPRKGQILAAITALKQICNHPVAYRDDGGPLAGRSGKLARLDEIVDAVFAAGERILVFTHFATWGVKLAAYLSERTGLPIECYHGGLSRTVRDRIIEDFNSGEGAGALVLSLKAGGTGLNLTAASHVVLYDRWWNPAVEDQARDRAWRIGQTRTVIAHRLVCPGTVDERVEEVVAGKRRIADLVLPKSSSLADLDTEQLRTALGIRPDALLTEDDAYVGDSDGSAGSAA
jgi:superfamily II DNA or RNA helicase